MPNYLVYWLPENRRDSFRLDSRRFPDRLECRKWYKDLDGHSYKWAENDYGIIHGWSDYTGYVEAWCDHVIRLCRASRMPHTEMFRALSARMELATMIPAAPLRSELRETWTPRADLVRERIARLTGARNEYGQDAIGAERIDRAIERETALLATLTGANAPPESFVIDNEPDIGFPLSAEGYPV